MTSNNTNKKLMLLCLKRLKSYITEYEDREHALNGDYHGCDVSSVRFDLNTKELTANVELYFTDKTIRLFDVEYPLFS